MIEESFRFQLDSKMIITVGLPRQSVSADLIESKHISCSGTPRTQNLPLILFVNSFVTNIIEFHCLIMCLILNVLMTVGAYKIILK